MTNRNFDSETTQPPKAQPDPSLEREALLALRRMRQKLEDMEALRHEGIAIIGMACKFPGQVEGSADYWRLLSEQGLAITDIPAERMDLSKIFSSDKDAPGKTYSRSAGLLDRIDEFDANFFNISLREASQTDPQQRIFLEGVWHALENAAIPPRSLINSETGVFVGATTHDYASQHIRSVAPGDIDRYSALGLALNAIAGRVSYVFGLHGPSMCIDSACSSSLVAVDRACRSLREGECSLAIAGGVNILAFSDSLIAASRWGMLSSSGRVLSFGRGDGFVRGEGCGVVVLKRLRAAVAAGDRVLGVIRGSAVNHDGPGSGLTVPNGRAQAMLLRSALQSAGLEPSAVGYVEAHGTGTRLGDPIEAEALGEVFAGPREAPLRIGSVKTNLGHLEAAAGIAGLIKLVLALEHREIPAQLPVGPLSEHVRWSELPLEVVTLAQPWTPIAGRRIGGVSAFGFSGTNAHVLVEEAPPLKPLQPGGYEHPGEVLALSAKSEGALERMIERYATHVESHPEQRWADLCHTAGAGRSHFRYRRAVAAQTADEGLQLLRALQTSAPASPSDRPRIGFLFGQQAAPLDATPARELYAGSSVFREVIDRCEQALQGHLEAPLDTVMRHEDQRAARLLHQPTHARAAEFALGCGLAAMWRDWGAEPAAFLGHGAGGWAAAVAREALPLEQAALLAITSSTPPMHEELLPQATLWIEMGLPSTSLETPGNVPCIASLRPGTGAWPALAQALAEAYTAGLDVDWTAWNRDRVRRRIALPGYAFERQRHWFTPSLVPPAASSMASSSVTTQDPEDHPLLGRKLRLAGPGTCYEKLLQLQTGTPQTAGTNTDTYSDPDLLWLLEHRIEGKALMPAAAFIEILLAAGDRMPGAGEHDLPLELEEVLFSAPMPLDRPCLMQVVVDPASDSSARVRIYSTPASEPASAPAWTLHAEGTVLRRASAHVSAAQPQHPSLEQLLSRCADNPGFESPGFKNIDPATFYARLNTRGAHFGPHFRGILRLWQGQGEALAEIRVQRLGQRLHLATLDACLQTAAAALPSNLDPADNAALLPFLLNSLHLHSPLSPHDQTCFVHTTLLPSNPQQPTLQFNITTNTQTQKTIASIKLQFKQKRDDSNRVFETDWVSLPELDASKLEDCSGVWLILADHSGTAQNVCHELSSRGGSCYIVYPGEAYRQLNSNLFEASPGSFSDLERVLRGLPAASTRLRIVHLWSLDAPSFDASNSNDVLASQELGYGSCLALTQAILRIDSQPSLFLTTQATKPNVTGRSSIAGPCLWSMQRALLAEHPRIFVKAIDVADPVDTGRLVAELSSSTETEVALQFHNRLVPQLTTLPVEPSGVTSDAIELRTDTSNTLRELHHQAAERREPAEDEVEIEVHAAGLNFRDVLNALGMLPSTTTTLGGECAGVVLRAGRGGRFSPGDKVVAFAPGLFRSHVTLKTSSVFHMPAGLTFEQAATLPVAHLSAIFALGRLAKLKRGEIILIHAGAGGLGQAAILYAKALGARVITSAGNEEKSEYLLNQGVELVVNSRLPNFAQQVLEATKGHGVDVVLNSLDGTFVDESLRVLATNGRFLEAGKRNVLSHDEIESRRPDAAYFPFDLGSAAEEDADLIRSLMSELVQNLDDEVLPPLPVRSFPSEDAAAAFSTMAQAKHIGKLALSYKHPWRLHPGPGTYLITGGLGSIGMEVAAWLVRRGANNLILMSRSMHAERDSAINQMKAAGCQVRLVYADCSESDQVHTALLSIPANAPLRGVVHCAGVLHDGTLSNQSWDSFEQVGRAKIQGTWNLHVATKAMPLDFFITFSSAASIVGSPGQANYVAANAFMDALAQLRHAQGRPALSINWGPWQGDGMATGPAINARHPGLRKILPSTAFQTVEGLLQRKSVQAMVLAPSSDILDPFPGEKTGKLPPLGKKTKSVSYSKSLSRGVQGESSTPPPIASRTSLIRCIQAELKIILGDSGANDHSEETSFVDTGVDSLSAVELRNALVKSLGRNLPSTVALDYPTIGELADYLSAVPSQEGVAIPQRADLTTKPKDPLPDSLSEEEAEQMLLQELERGTA